MTLLSKIHTLLVLVLFILIKGIFNSMGISEKKAVDLLVWGGGGVDLCRYLCMGMTDQGRQRL